MLTNKNDVISEFRFQTGKEHLHQAVKLVCKTIARIPLPTTLNSNELRLVIDESITNAMEHGNRWDEKKIVEVVIERCFEGVRVSIEDEGKGFDVSYQPLSLRKDSSRGRGISILKHFCDCTWNRKGNIISMILPVASAFEQDVDLLFISRFNKLKS